MSRSISIHEANFEFSSTKSATSVKTIIRVGWLVKPGVKSREVIACNDIEVNV